MHEDTSHNMFEQKRQRSLIAQQIHVSLKMASKSSLTNQVFPISFVTKPKTPNDLVDERPVQMSKEESVDVDNSL